MSSICKCRLDSYAMLVMHPCDEGTWGGMLAGWAHNTIGC